jgi:hypothetical protein
LGLVQDAIAAAARQRRQEERSSQPPTPPVRQRRLTGTEKAEQELLRLLLANDRAVRAVGDLEHLFSDPIHLSAYQIIEPMLSGLDPGVIPDLGGLLSGNTTEEASLLAELAMVDRPLSEAIDVVNRLESDGLTRRIADLERLLANLPAESQEYSDRFTELVALQQQKKQLRSRE